jgi:hypothetical protein
VTIAQSFSLQGESRPGSVTLAVVLQLLLAATFLIMPTLAYLYGARAQATAEAEVARQGFPGDVLARNHVNFGEGAVGLVLAVAIALGLVALAVLNLVGNPAGRIGSWILQPLLLIAGVLILSRQVFTARFPCRRLQEVQRCDPCRHQLARLRRRGHRRLPCLVSLCGRRALCPGDPGLAADHHPARGSGGERLLPLSSWPEPCPVTYVSSLVSGSSYVQGLEKCVHWPGGRAAGTRCHAGVPLWSHP